MMNPDELKTLADKLVNNTATAHERLVFVTELNAIIADMRVSLADAKKARDNN